MDDRESYKNKARIKLNMNVGNYDFKELEPEMLKFWEENRVYQKLKVKYKNKPKFYFLHGPPYTSGRIHIGHAWNNALKDIIIRYKRMQGLNVWDRFGYDMHGLPTENKVQKDLELPDKDAIENYGMDKFIKKCIDFSLKNAELMDKDLMRLAVWMDFDKAYYPIKNSFIENEWWFIKQAWDKDRLYKGKKVMHWCSSCETALAKHELEYENVTDTSIFIKLKIIGKENEYLVIWTTTPWTIPFNLAVMVNPELDYVKVKVDEEVWVVAKGLVGAFMGSVLNKKFEILEECKGEALLGVKYEHPLPLQEQYEEHKKDCKKPENVHSVILSSQYVSLDAGTGLVHCAPGCGPEDYEVGREFGIAPYNQLNEKGEFENVGKYTSMVAKKDDKSFIEEFDKIGCLVAKSPVEHEYAHCWRCKTPVVFRATEQWFLKIEDILPKMVKDNQEINWVPSFGKKAFDSWLTSLKDNSLTRQRFWGTPVPIWVCEESGEVIVVGSADELREIAIGEVPKDLHRPWIDKVKVKTPSGKVATRIPDVLDVWIDSGILSWGCLNYPKEKEKWDLFPADLVLEGNDQIRLWFSMLHICAEVALDVKAFKNVYVHGMILDYQGTKMSKSLGNVISPYKVVDEYGADVLRYYMCGTSAGENISFNWEDVKLKKRNLGILWNLHKWLINLCKELDFNPSKAQEKDFADSYGTEEKYILSRLHSTIADVTEHFEQYKIDQTIVRMESLFLDLSRTYIQLVRDKSSVGSDQERKTVAYTVFKVLFDVLKMYQVISPFISEKIYLNLREAFNLEEISIVLESWPKSSSTKIDTKLEAAMDAIGKVIQAGLYAREKCKLGVRWPIKELIVQTPNKDTAKAVETLQEIIKNQTNVKAVKAVSLVEGVKTIVKADYNKFGPAFKQDSPQVIAALASESAETVMEHIEKDGVFKLKAGGKEFEIQKDYITVERTVPGSLQEADFKGGTVYLDTERTLELEAEGYAREIMRRIQALRKTAGLEKTDRIKLELVLDADLSEMLGEFEDQIKEKVGADSYALVESSNLEHTSKEKIKGKELTVSLTKI